MTSVIALFVPFLPVELLLEKDETKSLPRSVKLLVDADLVIPAVPVVASRSSICS